MKKNLLTIAILALLLVSAFSQTPVRKVLLEEFTTASCGNCPMMSKYINDWHLAHASGSIMVAIHEGSGNDAMSTPTTDVIFNAMHPDWGWFAPAVMIDRGLYPWVDSVPYLVCMNSWGSGTGNPGIDTVATRLMSEPAKVGVNISGTYNSATRTINATVSAEFVSALPSGDWRINLFLVEDSVIGYPGFGAFAGWDQHCYDTPWANANYPGMFDGTSIIGYPHRHVMRNSLLGNWGAASIIPATPVVGSTYTTTTTLVVDTAFHDDKLSLVAFVSSYGANQNQKWVVNANDVKVTPAFATGINEAGSAQTENTFLSVYPNPTNATTHINYLLNEASKTEITITNVIGQKVETISSVFANAGKQDVSIDVSKYTKGIYFIELKTNSGKQATKLIVE